MYPPPRPTLRDRLVKMFTFDKHMVEEIYDGLLKEEKIQPMINKGRRKQEG